MTPKITFVVQTFELTFSALAPGQRKNAPTEYGALRKAEAMVSRLPGMAAPRIAADETEELGSATTLATFGVAPDDLAEELACG